MNAYEKIILGHCDDCSAASIEAGKEFVRNYMARVSRIFEDSRKQMLDLGVVTQEQLAEADSMAKNMIEGEK